MESLGEATFAKKLRFELTQLLVEEVVRLVDEADHGVGGDLR